MLENDSIFSFWKVIPAARFRPELGEGSTQRFLGVLRPSSHEIEEEGEDFRRTRYGAFVVSCRKCIIVLSIVPYLCNRADV